jgi:hypothetical protein
MKAPATGFKRPPLVKQPKQSRMEMLSSLSGETPVGSSSCLLRLTRKVCSGAVHPTPGGHTPEFNVHS